MPGAKASEAERRSQILVAATALAARDGVEGLSARRVAEAAGLSHGLVFFHFGSMDGLRTALLDHLLAGALDAVVTAEIEAIPAPAERLLELLRIEIDGLAVQRTAVELFFAYWSSGARLPVVRERISAALSAYRHVFEPVVADVISAGGRFAGADPVALTSTVIALIEGFAVQVVLDPDVVEVEPVMDALRRLLS